MKKIKNSLGNFWVAVPETLLKPLDNAKEIISLHKGAFFFLLTVCFIVGWFFANRCKQN